MLRLTEFMFLFCNENNFLSNEKNENDANKTGIDAMRPENQTFV